MEQKNFTHVRELFGYQRFDHPELVSLMNEIYQAYWNPLQNLFMATQKIETKTRIGGRIKKKYSKSQTLALRIKNCPEVPLHIKRKLKQDIESKNLFYLKQQLDLKLKEFFDLIDKLNKEAMIAS